MENDGSPLFFEWGTLLNVPLPALQILVKPLKLEQPVSFCVGMSSDVFLNHGKVEFLSLTSLS